MRPSDVARVTLMLMLSLGLPATVLAYDCTKGGEHITLTSILRYWADNTGQVVYLIGETKRSVEDADNCPGWVRVEGWIEGDPNGAMVHQSTHIARLGYPGDIGPGMGVPCYPARYTAHTKHWFIHDGWFGDPWTSIEDRTPTADAGNNCAPPPPPDPEEECDARGNDYYWDGDRCIPLYCPIIIDTARDGYHLTSAAEGVLFDLDADGTPERIAWTAADSDDAFLAMDRNGNGRIDNGSELFGNRTPAYGDRADVRSANGFDALNFLEGPTYGSSKFDQVLDGNDAAFGRLLLWRDLNHNGISEPDELQTVTSGGLARISAEAKAAKRTDRYGNLFRLQGWVAWADGVVTKAWDVWLRSTN